MITFIPILPTQLLDPLNINTIYIAKDENNITIALQILNRYTNDPYLIPDSSSVIIYLDTIFRDPLEKTATIDSLDKSIITINLTSDDTNKIIDGNIKVKILEPSTTRIAKVNNIIKIIK